MKLNGNLTLNSNATGEIQNVFVERLSAAPAFDAAQKGRLYFNTTSALYYYNDGAAWVPFATGGNAAALQTEVDNIEASLGAAVNGNGTFNAGALAGATYIGGATSVTSALTLLDQSINAHNTIAELDDVTLGALTNKDVLYFDAGSSLWRNASAGSTSGVQAFDTGLDSLAALTGPGFVAVDATGNVFSSRSITQPANGITVTNGDGSGNIVIDLANDLHSLEYLTTTGIAVRTAHDTWATRSIVGGLTGSIIVGNGDGVAGNTSLDLQTLTIPTTTGTFYKFAYDTYGRVTSVQAVAESDIAGLVDTRYINATGDAMLGNLNMSGYSLTNVADPVAGTDAVNKNYVESYVTGLSWKQAVKAATTGNVSLSAPGAAIDGVTLTSGTRVLVKNQSAAAENGIYTFNGTALVRASDADSATELAGATVFVQEGTVNADTGWTQTADSITLGTTAVTFAQFTGSGTYTAGAGMDLTGNTFSVNLGAGIAELPSDEVGIDLYNVGANPIILTTDGSTRSTATNAALDLKLDAGTLTKGANGLKVSAGGITKVELNSSALGANSGLTGGSGTEVNVNVDSVTLEVAANVVAVKDSGITTAKIADGTVTNVKLANSKVTLAGDAGVGTDLVLGTTVNVNGSNGVHVTAAAGSVTVALTAGLNLLSDVTITGAVIGQTLVNNGSKFVNAKIFHHYHGAASTTHSVIHAIGQRFCNVTVADDNGEVVIPQSITFIDDNTLEVTFTSAIACNVIVMGVNTTAPI